MAIPAFANVPTSGDNVQLPPEEWQACIESWILLAELYLKIPAGDWEKSLENVQSNTVGFLQSYFLALSSSQRSPQLVNASQLRRLCFLLSHRALSSSSIPTELLSWQFLVSICSTFPRNEELKKLLSSAWKRRSPDVDAALQAEKNKQIKSLDSGVLKEMETTMIRALPLLHQAPDVAAFLLTGSDLLDSIDAAYQKADARFRTITSMYVYLGFVGLLTSTEPRVSAVSDHLYSLKTSSKPNQASLLSDLASNTPLLPKLRDIMAPQDSTKLSKLEAILAQYRQPGTARPKRLVRRKVDKGKARDVEDEFGHTSFGSIHVHRMSKVTQVQDLFPDLGSGFILKLLDEYDDDVEQITAHLLDESLPAHLSGLDRTLQLPAQPAQSNADLASHLPPRSTPPLERRNVFDGDELDQLAADTSRLHFGRANKDRTADNILADRSTAPNKAAILSALAAFDSDDDERDDTYDVEDVGGTVDTSLANDEANADKNEEVLFAAWRMSEDTFGRDSAARRGKARAALKSETQMTDEAIEGWAIMLARDPRRLKRLEAKYATFTGQQNALERTAWRETEGEEGTSSGDDAFGGGRGRGRGRGRGFGGPRGGGGRGRGAPVSGPSGEAGTQQARQRKEASKGSRANHNRRDQRARKMARGGLAG